MNSKTVSTTNSTKLPELCAKCGNKNLLQLKDQQFRFRPLVGWIGIPFGITFEIVWNAKVYLCRLCSENIQRMQQLAILPPILGILFAVICLCLTFIYLDLGFTFLILGFLSFIGGFIFYSLLYDSANPKPLEVNRQKLILNIPNYGSFDYTSSKSAVRVK